MAILILLIIIMYFVCQKKEFFSFDKENTTFLKAILPFFIILHHSFMDIEDFRNLGVYVVSLFFFVSGYGLECNYLNNCKLDWGGVKRRYKKILQPLIWPIIIYCIIVCITQGITLSWIYDQITKYNIILPFTWFVLSLCQLYLIYYLTWVIFNEKKIIPFAILLTTYILILYYAKVQATYYCSLYGFLAGMVSANLIPMLKQYCKYAWFGIVGLVLTLIILKLHPPKISLYNPLLFVLSVAILLSAINTKGRYTIFFSKISYEIYLCQGIGFLIAGLVFQNRLVVFVMTVLISTIFAFICNKLTSLFFSHQLKQYL